MQRKTIQRQYKDRLFRMAFREKKHLLALYNAINGSAYDDPEALEIRTLEDVIYMGMKNDASFVLDDIFNLWEHQSSFNPNMPIRALSYFARLYQNYIDEHRLNIYSSKLQRLPFPQYIVFYNGMKKEPDRIELKLSDAFLGEDHISEDRQPCLEVRAVIREYEAKIPDREMAVTKAVDHCIANGWLTDILSKNRAEVIALFLTEYDEQAQRELDRAEAWEEGQWIKLICLARKKAGKGISVEEAAEMLEESPELIGKIFKAIREYPDWTDAELYERVVRQ